MKNFHETKNGVFGVAGCTFLLAVQAVLGGCSGGGETRPTVTQISQMASQEEVTQKSPYYCEAADTSRPLDVGRITWYEGEPVLLQRWHLVFVGRPLLKQTRPGLIELEILKIIHDGGVVPGEGCMDGDISMCTGYCSEITVAIEGPIADSSSGLAVFFLGTYDGGYAVMQDRLAKPPVEPVNQQRPIGIPIERIDEVLVTEMARFAESKSLSMFRDTTVLRKLFEKHDPFAVHCFEKSLDASRCRAEHDE